MPLGARSCWAMKMSRRLDSSSVTGNATAGEPGNTCGIVCTCLSPTSTSRPKTLQVPKLFFPLVSPCADLWARHCSRSNIVIITITIITVTTNTIIIIRLGWSYGGIPCSTRLQRALAGFPYLAKARAAGRFVTFSKWRPRPLVATAAPASSAAYAVHTESRGGGGGGGGVDPGVDDLFSFLSRQTGRSVRQFIHGGYGAGSPDCSKPQFGKDRRSDPRRRRSRAGSTQTPAQPLTVGGAQAAAHACFINGLSCRGFPGTPATTALSHPAALQEDDGSRPLPPGGVDREDSPRGILRARAREEGRPAAHTCLLGSGCQTRLSVPPGKRDRALPADPRGCQNLGRRRRCWHGPAEAARPPPNATCPHRAPPGHRPHVHSPSGSRCLPSLASSQGLGCGRLGQLSPTVLLASGGTGSRCHWHRISPSCRSQEVGSCSCPLHLRPQGFHAEPSTGKGECGRWQVQGRAGDAVDGLGSCSGTPDTEGEAKNTPFPGTCRVPGASVVGPW
ncbi:uncharacterized protein LOC116569507 [Mustela erminea]|uniref:uncharacterized protein LOC116569507 n=1 Tax=Mustela erminea TaxID=36723 RepID=UPI0013871CD3|nr:uncharacterized protein LOC116569507 [Mustela erminea]